MNLPFTPAFPLPSDTLALRRLLAVPGGLVGLSGAERPHVNRAIHGLDVLTLIELASGADRADGVALYETWLGAHGANAVACAIWFNLGVLRMQSGQPGPAAAAYRVALQLKPDMAEAAINLGTALEAAGDTTAAMVAWRAALPSASLRQMLHNQLGRVLETQGRLAEAAEELRSSLLITPDQPDVQQHLVHLRQKMASWPVTSLGVADLPDQVAARNCGPLAALALHDDPLDQAAAAALWIARKLPWPGGPLAPARGYAHDRIRVGYLSTDFCRHAMSFLIAGLLEQHDRSRFEIYGYCASPEDGSEIRSRVISAFDHFRPITALEDEAAAKLIRSDEIDILIDLNGLTKGARLEILRWKPAPVQITYLGYIGPVPLPELDYILCDDITIPPHLAGLYSPTPLPIAGCYQANDDRRLQLPQVSRTLEGLPDDAFVFTCMSHHYKITAPVFGAWCRILQQVPDSLLWLIDDGAESRAALGAAWQAAGLAPDRLLFAPRVDPDRYRARLALADLFLDTAPYNAGTIASDALRMGLPMVTLQGQAFSGRMASSLLAAVGLPEGITTSLGQYVERSVAIAQDQGLHADLRARLNNGAWARTLGDTAGFTRRFEQALSSVVLQKTRHRAA